MQLTKPGFYCHLCHRTLGKASHLALLQHFNICMQKGRYKPGVTCNYLLLSLGISLKAFMQKNECSFFMCTWMIPIKFKRAQISRLSQEAKDCISSSRNQELNLCQILMETHSERCYCTFSNSSSSTFLPSGNEPYEITHIGIGSTNSFFKTVCHWDMNPGPLPVSHFSILMVILPS